MSVTGAENARTRPGEAALLLLDLDETLLPTSSLLGVRHSGTPCDLSIIPAYATVRPHAGVEAALRKLASSLSIGIVTSSPRWYVEQILADRLPGISFAPVVTYDDVSQIKPDPEPLLTALRLAKVGVGDAVYVGDALEDHAACHAIGLRFLAAGWATGQPFPHPTTMLSCPSDLVVAMQVAARSALRGAPWRR